jgi:glycosyltransferase involved in cell wall biosynthesis
VRILLVQRSLEPPGGGNAVAAWMVHALAGSHRVDTLTLGEWSPAATNAFYGTAIPEGIERHLVPRPWQWVARRSSDHFYRLRMATLLRYARDRSAGYDLLITADDYGAFEQPGIQYLHFPAALSPVPARFPTVVGAYFRFCDWWLGVPWSRARDNLTLVNSQWTADRLAGAGETRVLYPPVVDTGPGLPWAARSNTILCVGRFHPSKRLDLVISIVRQLREQAIPDARLVLVGSAVDAGYARRLRQTVAERADWVEIREDLSRAELTSLMGRCRYGVHAMEGEHFGMATAEMVRAGCLVFPHRSGGSVEVVDESPDLLWATAEEAVARVSAVAGDQQLRSGLLARLGRHAPRFSADRFVAEFRAIVEGWRPPQVSSRKPGSASSS